MAIYPTDVKIPPTLSGAISGVGSPGYNAYNQIGSNYGAARKKLGTDATALGMNPDVMTGPGSYADQRLNATQGLNVGNLATALGAGLGQTGYQDTLQQRDYEQQRQLAEEIGRLNKPDLLQQILSGVGNVGGTAAQIYGAYGSRGGGRGKGNPSSSTLPPKTSLFNWNASNPYQYYMGGGY